MRPDKLANFSTWTIVALVLFALLSFGLGCEGNQGGSTDTADVSTDTSQDTYSDTVEDTGADTVDDTGADITVDTGVDTGTDRHFEHGDISLQIVADYLCVQ